MSQRESLKRHRGKAQVKTTLCQEERETHKLLNPKPTRPKIVSSETNQRSRQKVKVPKRTFPCSMGLKKMGPKRRTTSPTTYQTKVAQNADQQHDCHELRNQRQSQSR